MATFLNLTSQLEDLLREASASGSLLLAAEQTLGISSRLAELREQSEAWQNGVFSGLPAIRLLPGQNFTGGVAAAYAGGRKEIFVNQGWWDQASEADRTAVLLEELGHALQDRYGDGAALSGDTGQLFAADLLNLPLSDAQRAAISAENDRVSVLVDGVWVDANAAAYVGTVAADNFVGTSDDDVFSFDNGTFSVLGDDTIDGGVGNLDTLAFGSAIDFSNDDAFENVSNVERVTLANGANLLTLGINTDAAGITTVVGGTGNDTIDGSLSYENLKLIGGDGNDQLWAGSGDDTLTGDAGDDTFAFNSENLDFNDIVAGGVGNDILTFATGGVINDGNSGGLVGVSGVETIRLSAEGNKLSIADREANGLSLVLGGIGDDDIDASGRSAGANGEGLIFDMGSGDDTISGTQGKDTFRFAINELTGEDSIAAGQTGGDILEFTTNGTISDSDLKLLYGSNIATLQLSSAGTNSVKFGEKSSGTFNSILGGSANDDIDLSGRTSDTSLYAGAGSDKITLNNSTDDIIQLSTQSGTDTIVVSAAALTKPGVVAQMSGGSNEDTLSLSDVLDTGLKNTVPASTSIYNQGAGVSYELEGTSEELYHDQTKVVSIDKLQLANGSNKILLGAKSQRALTDEVIGGSENDVILADSNVFRSLKLDGGDANDMLGGGRGNDSLIGGNGNDTLIAGDGVDTLIGGAGIDVFRMDSSQFRSNDSIDGGTNVGGVDVLELWGESSVDDRAFAGVKGVEELVVVGNNADDGTDNASAMSIQLGALARASGITKIVVEDDDGVYLDLAQLTSANSVTGGAGDDAIVGFVGADTINGGVDGSGAAYTDTDTLFLNATSTDLNRAIDSQLENIEVINASNSTSGVLVNLTSQADEAFEIIGGSFDDTITGSNSNDTLQGGAGADSLVGGAGADTMIGGAGDDVLSGGAGADTFQFATSLVSGSLGTVAAVVASVGTDTIAEFVVADDQFKLDQTVFGSFGGTGVLNSNNFASVAGTGVAITASGLNTTNGGIVYDSMNKNVYFVDNSAAFTSGTTMLSDLVTSGDATIIATLTALTGILDANDFDVVA